MAISVRNVYLERSNATPQLGLQGVVAGRRFVIQGGDVAYAAERTEGIGIVAAGYRQIGGHLPASCPGVVHTVYSRGRNRLPIAINTLTDIRTVSRAYGRVQCDVRVL